MAEATVDARQWVQGSGYEEALRSYNDWVFGPNPVYRQGDRYLFIHGNINSAAVRHEIATVSTNTILVVHVVGVNFIIGDTDTQNNQLGDEQKVSQACQYSAQNEDKKVFVRIKVKEEPTAEQTEPIDEQTDLASWTDLTDLVREVSYPPSKFIADPNNPDLNKWDNPMPPGEHTGAWASKLLLLKIPQKGIVFELRSHGTGIPPYQQQTHFEIKVE